MKGPDPETRLSAVIITMDEESRLARCLDSVRWMDEMIVVDSGSRDRTRDIALRYTPLVFHRDFDDYASQKNYALSKASGEWIFSIDADEVMTPSLRFEIVRTLSDNPKKDMFAIPRENVYFGHSVRHVLGTDEPVRLFRSGRCSFQGSVHEKVVGGVAGRLNSPLMHYSCRNYAEWRRKKRVYTRMDAEKQFGSGRRFSILRFFLSPWRVFLFRYASLQGWRDGWPGLAISLELAISTMILEMELCRLSRLQKRALA